MNRKAKNIALGTVVAGLVGYVAGILTAPRSGRQTRSTIRNVQDSGFAQAEKQLKRLHIELGELLGEADKKSKHESAHSHEPNYDVAFEGEIVTRATRTRQKAREIISALHNGDADDRDLDKAISEASKAVQSIKSYLKKK